MAAESNKMFSHERTAGKDEWLTPKYILDALGPFDLDPCASVVRPWSTAVQHYTIEDNGLTKPWSGRVWCNPPYGSQTGRWMARLRDHGDGIALVFARTETRMFFESAWGGADAMLFLAGRLAFCDTAGRPAAGAGAPSVLIAYGAANAAVLRSCGLRGAWIGRAEVVS